MATSHGDCFFLYKTDKGATWRLITSCQKIVALSHLACIYFKKIKIKNCPHYGIYTIARFLFFHTGPYITCNICNIIYLFTSVLLLPNVDTSWDIIKGEITSPTGKYQPLKILHIFHIYGIIQKTRSKITYTNKLITKSGKSWYFNSYVVLTFWHSTGHFH